jgi:hypothetical protein
VSEPLRKAGAAPPPNGELTPWQPPAGVAAPLGPLDGVDGLVEREPLVRIAKKAGRRIVTLRRIDVGVECIVECDVYPLNSLRVEPVRPGPYRFARRHEGDGFVEEAMRALEYLGCDV